MAAEVVDALDLRLIACDRPGLDVADPHPEKTPGAWADDIGLVIRQRGLAAFVCGKVFLPHPEGTRGTMNALTIWPFQLEKITVDLWYGGLDTGAVHWPDFSAALAARLPNPSRLVDPAEGRSILSTGAGVILKPLALSPKHRHARAKSTAAAA